MIDYDTCQVLRAVSGTWRASLLTAGLVMTVIVGRMMTLSKGVDCSIVCNCKQSTYPTQVIHWGVSINEGMLNNSISSGHSP